MNPSTQTAIEEKVSLPCAPPPAYDDIVPPPYPPYLNALPSLGPAVVTQPQPLQHIQPLAEFRNDWMEAPFGFDPNCPRGLQYLCTLDRLLIKQKDSPRNKKYIIKNALGQNVYMAVEDIDSRVDSCYDMFHPVDVKVLDLYRNSVIYFNRSVSCLLQTIEVSSSPEGQVIGSIREGLAWWGECYKIKNRNGETVLRIEGPSCLCSCGSNIDFKILDTNGTEIGQISNKWSGSADFFNDADYLSVSFPKQLDVKMKAALIGACMLIDFSWYEYKSCDS